MAYSATDAKSFRIKKGSLSEKLAAEFSSIQNEFERSNSHFVVLTAGVGTNTALATAGIDLASGSDIQVYGAFIAPCDIVLVKMHDYLTEAYVKSPVGAPDPIDAKIEIYNDATSPVKLFGRTLTAAGEAAKLFTSTDPESGATAVTAGTRLDLKAVNTSSSSGTGHAIVILEYVEA